MLDFLIFAIPFVTWVVFCFKTGQIIKDSDDIDKENMSMRSFLTTLFGGPIFGALVVRSNNNIIRKEWNEHERITKSNNRFAWPGAILATIDYFLYIAGNSSSFNYLGSGFKLFVATAIFIVALVGFVLMLVYIFKDSKAKKSK